MPIAQPGYGKTPAHEIGAGSRIRDRAFAKTFPACRRLQLNLQPLWPGHEFSSMENGEKQISTHCPVPGAAAGRGDVRGGSMGIDNPRILPKSVRIRGFRFVDPYH